MAPDAESLPTPLPQGTLPAATAAAACALDAAVHAWDVTSALGQPSGLTPDLAAQLLPTAREIVEPLREYGSAGGDAAEFLNVDVDHRGGLAVFVAVGAAS